MTNPGELFADEINNWLMDSSGFDKSRFKMSVYYKYSPDGSKLVLLFYVDDFVYWYTY